MRIAIAQLNPIVGDLSGNRALVEQAAERAAAEGADLVVLLGFEVEHRDGAAVPGALDPLDHVLEYLP